MCGEAERLIARILFGIGDYVLDQFEMTAVAFNMGTHRLICEQPVKTPPLLPTCLQLWASSSDLLVPSF